MNSERLPLGFVYHTELVGPDGNVISTDTTHNLIPQMGVDHIVGLIRGSGAVPISNWYLGLIENNYVPVAGVTPADIGVAVTEAQDYSEVDRPAWTHIYDGTAVVDNLDSKAVYSFTANKTIYGVFLVSSATKGGNTGTLMSVARFNSPQNPVSGSTLNVAVGITLIPAQVV